ncbi:MAG: histidine kinase, partial [Kibdelosporangium sp.]
IVIAYLGWSLIAGLIGAAWPHGWPGVPLYLVLFAAGLVCCVVVYRRDSLSATNLWWLAGAAAIALAMTALAEFGGVGLLFLVVWVAPFRTRLRHVVLLTVLVAGGFVAVASALGQPQASTFGIAVGMGWAALLAAILHQLAVTRQQGADVAVARANAAVLNERQRLAREVHDILAHSLSAQIVHLEGAKLLLEQGGDAALVLNRVIRAGDLARSGLEDTKRAVEALRGDQAPLADQLERLANQFRTATGRPCEVLFDGDTGQLAPEAWLAVVRTTQEALTNVHKHAPEAHVMLRLRCEGDWCELQVRDTGGHVGELSGAGSGYGLVGMRERAELIGGTLDAGPDGDGFRVRLRVPA